MTASSGPVNQSSPKRRVFLVEEGAAKFPPLAGLGGSRVSEKKGGRHDELSFWGTRESETLLHLGVSGVVPRRAAQPTWVVRGRPVPEGRRRFAAMMLPVCFDGCCLVRWRF